MNATTIKTRPCRCPVLRPAECSICRAATTNPKFAHWQADLPADIAPTVARQANKFQAVPECIHRGEPTGERRECKTCKGSVQIPLLACSVHGVCTATKEVTDASGKKVKTCVGCTERIASGPGAIAPTLTHEFTGLAKSKHNTNCSLLPFRGRRLLAYRSGWANARIRIAEVADDWSVISDRVVRLNHPAAIGGQEDPRLFVRDGSLYVAFIGTRHPSTGTIARQLFAKLDDDLQPVRIWEPSLTWSHGEPWEKNWQPFSLGTDLFAVYSVNPWRIVRLFGGEAIPHSQADGLTWDYGDIRGGAPPVRMGDEFYCFFHGTDKRPNKRNLASIYTVGVCTFDAKTLAPKRLTRRPILWPDWSPSLKWHTRTAFPCGAYLDGDQWVLSYGSNDHACRISAFRVADAEAALCPI